MGIENFLAAKKGENNLKRKRKKKRGAIKQFNFSFIAFEFELLHFNVTSRNYRMFVACYYYFFFHDQHAIEKNVINGPT